MNWRVAVFVVVVGALYFGSYVFLRSYWETNQDGPVTQYDERSLLGNVLYIVHGPVIYVDSSLTGRSVVLKKWR
jgi:hypothetical protein